MKSRPHSQSAFLLQCLSVLANFSHTILDPVEPEHTVLTANGMNVLHTANRFRGSAH